MDPGRVKQEASQANSGDILAELEASPRPPTRKNESRELNLGVMGFGVLLILKNLQNIFCNYRLHKESPTLACHRI